MRELGEIIVDTFDDDHGLATAIDGEGHVFHALSGYLDLGQLSYLCQHRVVGSHSLTLFGHHLQLRVEGGEEGSNEVVEPIKHAEGDDQGHRSHSHTNYGNATDDINGMSGFLRE